MRILFLARQPPVSLDNGSRIRTHALASHLTGVAQLQLLAFDTQPGSRVPGASAEDLTAALPATAGVTLVRPSAARKRRLQLQTLLGGSSYLLRQHRSAAMQRALLRAIEDFRPDLLHCDNLLLGDFARLAPRSLVRVIAPENVESLLLRRMADTSSARLRASLYRREAKLLARWEQEHLREFDLCLAVSDQDANRFAALGANAVCVPNGVAPHPPPKPVRALPRGAPLKLLFVGSGGYEPNRAGVRWFIEHVLGAARCEVPPQLTLVGSGWERIDDPRCHVAGRVASLDPYYQSHDVAVVPLLSGGGSRLKVAEALAKGIPLLGTSVGLEGYPLEHRVHALFADTPAQQAERLRWLEAQLHDRTAVLDRQVAAGYELIERFFWDRIGAQLAGVYAEQIERRRGARDGELASTRRLQPEASDPHCVVTS